MGLFKNLAVAVTLLGSLGAASVAGAVSFGFERVLPANSTIDAAAQFMVDVTEGAGANAGKALFDFKVLAGAQTPYVAEIYFDVGNGIIISPISVLNNSGTSFSTSNSTNPGNLPGGNNVGFSATSGILIDSDVSGPPNNRPFPNSDGLQLNDVLVLAIGYGSGFGFSDVITAMNNGDIRIGLHARQLANGASDSFVTIPNPIPLPAAAWLLLGGLGGLGLLARRRAA